MRHLKEGGIGTEIYYPLLLHLQACYSGLGYKEGDLPISESAAKETIAIPVYPGLGENDMTCVAIAIERFYERDR